MLRLSVCAGREGIEDPEKLPVPAKARKEGTSDIISRSPELIEVERLFFKVPSGLPSLLSVHSGTR